MKKLKFNQCQDCGCPGNQLIIISRADGMGVVQCPCCRRTSVPFVIDAGAPVEDNIILAVESWNINNRENKEGLG